MTKTEPFDITLEEWIAMDCHKERISRSGSDMYYHRPEGGKFLWAGITSKKTVIEKQHRCEVHLCIHEGKRISARALYPYQDLIKLAADKGLIVRDGAFTNQLVGWTLHNISE